LPYLELAQPRWLIMTEEKPMAGLIERRMIICFIEHEMNKSGDDDNILDKIYFLRGLPM
jgi:hypothetical protein